MMVSKLFAVELLRTMRGELSPRSFSRNGLRGSKGSNMYPVILFRSHREIREECCTYTANSTACQA
eukprot:1133013-Pelagomonas_calceolata.AAC.1